MYRILEKQILSDAVKLMVVDAPHVARKAQRRAVRHRHHPRRGRAHPVDHRRPRLRRRDDHPDLPGSRQIHRRDGPVGTWATVCSASPARWATPPRSRTTARWSAWRAASASRRCIPSRAPCTPPATMSSRSSARGRASLLFWEDEMRAVSDELIVCTDDGSYGRKALVTEPLKEVLLRARGRKGMGHRPDDHDEIRLRDHANRSTSPRS